jgi:DNA-directed RNA polymerase specialized sigma24 family protein
MIEYINKRLNEWASWCKRRDDGGLGYPSQSNYCAALQIRGTASAGAITQFAAEEEIEGIVVQIRKASPQQWEVAQWFYLKGSFTKQRIAKELGCSEVTVYNRLHALHVAVMNALQDLEIEAQDRAEAIAATQSLLQRVTSPAKSLAVAA